MVYWTYMSVSKKLHLFGPQPSYHPQEKLSEGLQSSLSGKTRILGRRNDEWVDQGRS
jgi:hypothetical protein